MRDPRPVPQHPTRKTPLWLPRLPDLHANSRGAGRLGNEPWPRTGLRGRGQISGAWLTTDGAEMSLSLSEPRGSGPRREFSLYGTWHGENLALDDHKSMFIHFRSDGKLTPSGSYTSPVPEKHATVTLTSGSLSDFESICAGLR